MITNPRRLAASWLAAAAAATAWATGGVGCAQAVAPPIVERSPVLSSAATTYRVHGGDTLYSIAWRHGVDARAIAAANNLRPPYTIHVGQELDLRPSRTVRRDQQRAPSRLSGWRWPVDQTPVRRFSDRAGGAADGGAKGLDFDLPAGTQIVASAAGEVVYAGQGVGGYRHLVIVRHSAAYLSAYGFNTEPHVAEGARVKSGAMLARTSAQRGVGTRLHFEIRRDGRPVDPAALIRS